MLRNALRVCSIFVLALGFVLTLPAAAQEEGQAMDQPAMDESAMDQPAMATEDGFQRDVAADLEATGDKLISLAEAFPADKYGWRPAEGIRSVSEVFVHVANGNTLMPGGMGMKPPTDVELPPDMPATMAWMKEQEATVTAKDDVIAALKKSIAYAAGAVRGLDGTTLDDEINMFGFPASRRAYVLILLTHNHEHLGQAIAYARSIGVVPPWSQPAATEEEEAPTEAAAPEEG